MRIYLYMCNMYIIRHEQSYSNYRVARSKRRYYAEKFCPCYS